MRRPLIFALRKDRGNMEATAISGWKNYALVVGSICSFFFGGDS